MFTNVDIKQTVIVLLVQTMENRTYKQDLKHIFDGGDSTVSLAQKHGDKWVLKLLLFLKIENCFCLNSCWLIRRKRRQADGK